MGKEAGTYFSVKSIEAGTYFPVKREKIGRVPLAVRLGRELNSVQVEYNFESPYDYKVVETVIEDDDQVIYTYACPKLIGYPRCYHMNKSQATKLAQYIRAIRTIEEVHRMFDVKEDGK